MRFLSLSPKAPNCTRSQHWSCYTCIAQIYTFKNFVWPWVSSIKTLHPSCMVPGFRLLTDTPILFICATKNWGFTLVCNLPSVSRSTCKFLWYPVIGTVEPLLAPFPTSYSLSIPLSPWLFILLCGPGKFPLKSNQKQVSSVSLHRISV